MIRLEELQEKCTRDEVKLLNSGEYNVQFEDYSQEVAIQAVNCLQIFAIGDDCIVETTDGKFLAGGIMGKNINCWAKCDTVDEALKSL